MQQRAAMDLAGRNSDGVRQPGSLPTWPRRPQLHAPSMGTYHAPSARPAGEALEAELVRGERRRFFGSAGTAAERQKRAMSCARRGARTLRNAADFAALGLPRSHAIRLGNNPDAPILDGYPLSRAVWREIFECGGFSLLPESPLYERGVAALANAPNTLCGRGGCKGGFANAVFLFDDGRACEDDDC